MGLDKKTFRQIALLILLTAVLIWAGTNLDKVGGLLRGLLRVLTPFIIGGCIAFVVNVLLRPIEALWIRLWKKRPALGEKLRRAVCLPVSALIVLGILFALLFMIIPELKRTLTAFIGTLPGYIARIEGYWRELAEWLSAYSIALPELSLDEMKIGKAVSDFLLKDSASFLNRTLGITTSIFAAVVDAVLAIAFSMYLLAQKEKLLGQMRRLLLAVLPEERAQRVMDFAKLTNHTFASFVTGQLLEALIIGTLCFIGMVIFRMPYALMISLTVCVTALVPVFGAFIGTAIGAVLIFMVNPMQALWFIVFIIILQQLEGNLIYPRVVGRVVGLPGIWVLAAVTIGGSTLGVVGMLLSVPVCSVLYCLVSRAVYRRLRRKGFDPDKKIA